MSQPQPGQPVQVVNPLNWQIGHATAPDGTPMCLLSLSQGQLAAQLQLNAHDMAALGRGLISTAEQARTGLIIPNGAVNASNGHGSSATARQGRDLQ